jgi:hypothetical protein
VGTDPPGHETVATTFSGVTDHTKPPAVVDAGHASVAPQSAQSVHVIVTPTLAARKETHGNKYIHRHTPACACARAHTQLNTRLVLTY